MLELLSIMLNVIAPIFLVLSVAYLIGKRFNPDPRSLSPFLIYLFVPSLVFKGIYQTELSGSELGGIALVVIGVALVNMGLATAAARLLNYSPRAESALVLTVILVNAANYGIPLNTFAFGEVGFNVAIVYYVVAAQLGNILGVYFASRGAYAVKDALLNVFKVPIAYAAIIGFVFNLADIKLPLILERSVIDIASGASIPMMLALLGLQLSRISFKRTQADAADTLASNPRAIGVAVALKLLIAPFIALGLALILGLSGTVFKVAIVESSMPTAVMATALATQFEGDARYVSAVTVAATLLSVPTLTLLIFLLGGVTG